MKFFIKESENEGIDVRDKYFCVYINNFDNFNYENVINYFCNTFIGGQIFFSDRTFNDFKINGTVKNYIFEYVTGQINYNALKEEMEKLNLSSCDLRILLAVISKYFLQYNTIKEGIESIDKIIISCREDNILRAIKLAKEIKNKPVILECRNIKEFDLYNLINTIDVNDYYAANISVYFDGYSGTIELYKFILNCKNLMEEVREVKIFCKENEAAFDNELTESESIYEQDDILFTYDVLTPTFNKQRKLRRHKGNKVVILN